MLNSRMSHTRGVARAAAVAVGLMVVAPCNVQYPPYNTRTYWGVAIAWGDELTPWNEGAAGLELAAARGDTGDLRSMTTYIDLSLYGAAAGVHEIIRSTEAVVSPGDILYDQYSALGVLFADGAVPGGGNDDTVLANAAFIDGRGVNGSGSIELLFTSPRSHIGVEFPGNVRLALYDGLNLLWSGDFGTAPTGNFGGVVSSTDTFDRVIISDPVDGYAFIDNLHYQIPEPGTILLLAGGGLAALRRARCSRSK
ncbi:MAG: PEP-CTERM sorting domain-containing protein [Planctomycetota bacterium]